MTVTISPGPVQGTLAAVPSKSTAHRLLIAAALADRPTRVVFRTRSQDIEATLRCLAGLGAGIEAHSDGVTVTPIPRSRPVGKRILDCGESGSTLRFLVPVAGALGADASFLLAGRLARRPMEPLASELARHGCSLDLDPEAGILTVSGQLTPGDYALPGNVSSQFFTGLLLALPLLERESTLAVLGDLESAGYLDLTLDALHRFSLTPAPLTGSGWRVLPQDYVSPGQVSVEGDWSNAAPWLCMGVLGGSGVTVTDLDNDSLQGDRAVCRVLARLGGQITQYGDRVTARPGVPESTSVDARNIPDLVPVLAAVAAVSPGTVRFTGASRLRLKESDRLATTAGTLNALGAKAAQAEDGLVITGVPRLQGGTVDAAGDHRIAMAAAVASVACQGPVTVTGAEAVGKSYPSFWEDLHRMGKTVETNAQAL